MQAHDPLPESRLLVALMRPRGEASERVRTALAGLDATVVSLRTMRQLRRFCRQDQPDLIVLELDELHVSQLPAEIERLPRLPSRPPIFVISNGLLPGERPVVVQDIADFATAGASSSEIFARLARVVEQADRAAPDAGRAVVADSPECTIDGVHIDWRNRSASIGGTSIRLTAAELRLFEALLRQRDRTVSMAALTRAACADGRPRSENFLAVYIFALRGKLRALAPSMAIENEAGIGYRLIGDPATPRCEAPGGHQASRRSA